MSGFLPPEPLTFRSRWRVPLPLTPPQRITNTPSSLKSKQEFEPAWCHKTKIWDDARNNKVGETCFYFTSTRIPNSESAFHPQPPIPDLKIGGASEIEMVVKSNSGFQTWGASEIETVMKSNY